MVNWHICQMFRNLNWICGVDLILLKKNEKWGDNWGFKESREAAINVIPSLGFSVNELGDHIPNPQTHSSHTKLFLQLSSKSKKEKMPSVDKRQTNVPDLLATVCASMLKHEFPPVIHIHALLSKVHTVNIHLAGWQTVTWKQSGGGLDIQSSRNRNDEWLWRDVWMEWGKCRQSSWSPFVSPNDSFLNQKKVRSSKYLSGDFIS